MQNGKQPFADIFEQVGRDFLGLRCEEGGPAKTRIAVKPGGKKSVNIWLRNDALSCLTANASAPAKP